MNNNGYVSQRKRLRQPVRLPEELKRDRLALLGACVIAILLVMTVLTSYYLPKTYGEILSCKEFYPSNKPFTFRVELGPDEYWHVKSWTDTEGTNYNVTLAGHPIVEEDPETTLASDSFTYNWKLSLNSPSSYSAHEFDLKIPQISDGNKWIFDILIEGHGSIHITITKFDGHNFYMFLIPDVIGTVIISVIIISIVKQRTESETNTYQFPIRTRNS
ncbi:hypothetical protein KAU30_00480 [Candidatus Bathyarchaeota archaeon]|nr:hypothetical protein [Candidatus Bathyarchaeota archaeon]